MGFSRFRECVVPVYGLLPDHSGEANQEAGMETDLTDFAHIVTVAGPCGLTGMPER